MRSEPMSLAPRPLSNPRIPVIAAVFPVTAAAAGDAREAVGDLDAVHIFGVFVAELAFDAQAQRRTMGDFERAVVQRVGDDRLGVERIDEIDALVILAGALLAALRRLAGQIVGAMEHGVAGAGRDPRRLEQQVERHAGPLADRAPALDAI